MTLIPVQGAFLGVPHSDALEPDLRSATTATRLAARFSTLEAIRRARVAELAAAPDVVTVESSARRASGPCVVFTGSRHALARAEAERMVERRGRRTARHVSHATDLVVAGSGAGAKLPQARTLGVPIISDNLGTRIPQPLCAATHEVRS